MKVVSILSGGLDSTVALYQARDLGHTITSAVSFNYGQNHKKELEYAARTCAELGIKHHIIDLHAAGVTEAIKSGSSLLQGADAVPEGHYAEESMKSTVVPNRNMMMISIAGAIAVAEHANTVLIGVHAGDHFIYPDCRPDFIHSAEAALFFGNEGFGSFVQEMPTVWAPFIGNTKTDIGNLAYEMNVPITDTWSCYKGGDKHCGKCGTCVERKEALGENDPTEYED